MLRINHPDPSERAYTSHLEGRIMGPWVAELEQLGNQPSLSDGNLRLNLANVDFVDHSGAELLRRLKARGVILLDCPAYILAELEIVHGARTGQFT